ncbi:PrpR N-terminal domain-containing protein [Geobacillus kaustophilus]|uniref:PrpR N-terminal domain-containing protein n=1 Tax=Geobacillus kaustophilus TaxID=1462 RepID=UPI002E207DA9|nr:PrpR N-terminal domain-containing protein [Geobacillus kaustophilus]MED3668589.1 PrpR N-terminal domain-containing protein [Geobacillus kaustophilus]
MNIKTLLIAPYPGLRELALSIAQEQKDLDVIVVQADLQEAVPIVKQYEKEGIDLVISRGGTAKLLRQHTSLPVIEIQVSGYDILRILTLVKDYHNNHWIIGFTNICQGFVSVSNLLGIHIPYTIIHNQSEVDEAVEKAKAAGAQTIIGDTVTCKTAEAHGLHSILITSGKESVIEAFEQARQTYQMIQHKANEAALYKQLLHKSGAAVAMYNEQGVIQYASPTFQHRLAPMTTDLGESSIVAYFPFLDREYHALCRAIAPVEIEYVYIINDERVHLRQGHLDENYYYLRVSKPDSSPADHGLTVTALQPVMRSFSQIIGNSEPIQTMIRQGEQAAMHREPLALYGEQGTGKKTLAGIIHCEQKQPSELLLFVRLVADSRRLMDRLRSIFAYANNGTCVLQGVEQLPATRQDEIAQLIPAAAARILFLFEDSPVRLWRQKRLSPHLLKQLKPNQIRLPSLRECLDDLEEYARKFIAQYNVKYGKQIVGIDEEALKQLRRHHWKGNWKELSNVIEQAVQSARREYIGIDELRAAGFLSNETGLCLDLQKPLAEIEKEIIWKVLKEEDMNQTKAAKRLGINRSTLWRKLK